MTRLFPQGALGAFAGAAVAAALGLVLLAAPPAAAAPSLSLSATEDAVIGQTLEATAELLGSPGPSGEITFRVYGPEDSECSTTPGETPVPASVDGTYFSGAFTPPSPGTYSWSAHYSGESENVDSNCFVSNVAKASPTLTGTATSAVTVGSPIGDAATLAGGFEASGTLLFRAYGPDDSTCAGAPAYAEAVAIDGDGTYSPPGFSPGPGLFRWTVEYEGDASNEQAVLGCGAENQASAVGTVSVALTASASNGTVGSPVTATASIQKGAIPAGQITFTAYAPGNANCSGAAVFSSTVSVAGNGSYSSAPFVPARVGTFRWTVSYSGDANHAPAAAACGMAASGVSRARPSITGSVKRRLTVGTSFRVKITLQGAYEPGGTVTFRVYGPVKAGCAKALSVDTVAVAGSDTVRSDPFTAGRPGRYSFVASYSGDAANQGAVAPCDSPGLTGRVRKRTLSLTPRAHLKSSRRILIRARLSGGASPSGAVNFRLFRPGDRRCRRKPAFGGAITVKSNGTYLLAKYLATRSGIYRLVVGYSGDGRNKRYKGSCQRAQTIPVPALHP